MHKLIHLLLITILLISIHSAFVKAQEPTHVFSVNDIHSDFKELYKRLKLAHYNLFVNTSIEEFDKYYSKILSQINKPMSLYELTLLFQKFVSKADIAHTRIDLPYQQFIEYRKKDGKYFPLYIRVIDGDIFIVENYSGSDEINIGDQIVSINGIKVKTLLTQLRSFISADTDQMFYGLLETQFSVLMWFEYGPVLDYKIVIQTKTDEIKAIQIKAKSRKQMSETNNQSSEILQPSMDRKADILDGGIAYLRPGPFYNIDDLENDTYNTNKFQQFIDDSFNWFIEKETKLLLIDLRNNPGGDNSFSDLMVRWFANKEFNFSNKFFVKVSQEFIDANESRLKAQSTIDKNSASFRYSQEYKNKSIGDFFEFKIPKMKPLKSQTYTKPVYVLVNRHSYSNAVTTAALVQDYGFAKIIGEKTNDLATTYGAMESFKLKNTGIKVGFPKAFIIRPNGSKKVAGIAPDILIPTPLIEYKNDVVLQSALEAIQKDY